jgi:hypothetical protein
VNKSVGKEPGYRELSEQINKGLKELIKLTYEWKINTFLNG